MSNHIKNFAYKMNEMSSQFETDSVSMAAMQVRVVVLPSLLLFLLNVRQHLRLLPF
jgi:hypothetical protein